MTDLYLLVQRDILTPEQAETLGELGIHSLADLFIQAQVPFDRKSLAERVNIPAENLLCAAALARLLRLTGPGSYAARKIALEANLGNLSDPDQQGVFEAVLHMDRPELLNSLASLVDQSQDLDQRVARRSLIRRLTVGVGLSFLAIVLVGIFSEWRSLFPTIGAGPGSEALRGFYRSKALITIGWGTSFTAAIALLFLSMYTIINPLKDWIDKQIWHMFLSPRDLLIAIDAGARVSTRLERIVDWVSEHLIAIYIVPQALMIAIFQLHGEGERIPSWAGYITGVIVGGVLLVTFQQQIEGFRHLPPSWANPTRERYAAAQALRSATSVGIVIVLGLVLLPVVFQVVTTTTQTWVVRQHERRLERFVVALSNVEVEPGREAVWEERREDWISWAEGCTQEAIDYHRDFDQESLFLWESAARALTLGWLGALLALGILEYVYVNHTKGALALVLWVIIFVASEALPSRIAQMLGGSPATTLGIGLSLGVSAFVGILGEFGMGRAEREDERECTNPDCRALLAEGDHFCRECGARVEE